jgi:hypothetical protein
LLLLFQSAGDFVTSSPEQAASTYSKGSSKEGKMQFYTMQTEGD